MNYGRRVQRTAEKEMNEAAYCRCRQVSIITSGIVQAPLSLRHLLIEGDRKEIFGICVVYMVSIFSGRITDDC